jgi:Tol biopolymer transport system component
VPPALATLTGVQAPAVSADGTTVAALRSVPGGVQLLAGPYSGPTRVRLSATRITPPSFDPSGDVVVAADSPTGRRIVELTTDGKTVRVHAPASVLAGPVSDLLISPDGTRVAMVLGVPGAGRLVVGLLAVDHGQPSIVGVHQVLPSTSDVQGLAWNGPGVIVTTTRSGASGRTVLASDTDGYSPHDLSVTRVPGPPVQVADAPGQRVLAVADDVLYRLVGTEWQRLSTGSDPSYAG